MKDTSKKFIKSQFQEKSDINFKYTFDQYKNLLSQYDEDHNIENNIQKIKFFIKYSISQHNIYKINFKNFSSQITTNIEQIAYDVTYKSMYTAVNTPHLNNSAKYINFNMILKKTIHFVIILCILVPINFILSFSALICCYVNIYRLILILVNQYNLRIFKTIEKKQISTTLEQEYIDIKDKNNQNDINFININQNFCDINHKIQQDISLQQYIQQNKINHNICTQNNTLTQSKEEFSDDLPIYSVLVPVYKEAVKIGEIITALSSISYPKNKLEIKLIVEEGDFETRHALDNEHIPKFIEIIKVPLSFPKTKPKALNYAMNFIKGEFVTIYDAEDIPESNQLLKMVNMFKTLSNDYICIQCKLNFFNFNENTITEFMSMEYATLFNYILPGSEKFGLPLLLGGTSNHFRVSLLKNIGSWDSYNVTEDAELAIRLYLNGYKVKMGNSITLEEAPTQIKTFIKQRSRWIKGFLQTFFCYFKYLNLSNFKLSEIIFIITNLLLFSFSMLLGPLLIIFGSFMDIKFLEINFYIFMIYHLVVSIFSNPYNPKYHEMFQFGKKQLNSKDLSNQKSISKIIISYINLKYLICAPAYYCMHSVAFIIAVFDLVFQPFEWRKTVHGTSNSKIDKKII